MYFFDSNTINFKPIPYDQLITDQKFYSQSEISNWHKIDLGAFKIETPMDYNFYKMEGIDSYIGGITNQTDTFLFDYGLYSNELNNYGNSNQFEISSKKINGKKFKIVKEKIENGFIGAYTADLKKDKRLSIVCLNCNDLNKKNEILKTIEFK
tara:strand:- start:61 stop:519 length:459 start_codon:yes stop_codon:yes gene_type:complete